MPVFARTKLMMEERCITLRPRLELSFKGPNPQNAYNKLLDILTHDIQIPRENIQEKEFNWERGSENEKFTAKFEIIKDFDKYSYMFLEIEMKGNIKPSKEFGKEGDMNIVIEGMVRTEYPQDTTWERSFLYEIFRMFYHKVFYQDQRKKYIENCRDWLLTIQSELKAFFNLLPKSG